MHIQGGTRGTSLIGKGVRDVFRAKGFIQIFDGFFLKTKGFSPKVYEIFGSEMPLGEVSPIFLGYIAKSDIFGPFLAPNEIEIKFVIFCDIKYC